MDFKAIPEFEGLYQISPEGVVRRLNKSIKSKPYKVAKVQKFVATGYLYVTLCKNNKQRNYLLHRLLAMTFIPNPEGLPVVNHINGIKTDCRLANLEWCTSSGNVKHAYDAGLNEFPKTKATLAKISMSDAAEIRRLHGSGTKMRQLATHYKISYQSVSNIINHKTWKTDAIPENSK